MDKHLTKEKNRGRIEIRTVKLYNNNLNDQNKQKWDSVQTIIEVNRVTKYRGKKSKETAYFISDLPVKEGAKYFYKGIRDHWRIESFHFVKDVTFAEDKWRVRSGNSPANYSLIRSWSINIFRKNCFTSFQAAIEKCANDVHFIMTLF